MNEIRVLIVEDEPITAEDIAACLNQMDYHISAIVYDYEGAMYELTHNPPDIALLDIHLENDADGILLAEYIHHNLKIPFVFLTAYADRKTIEAAKKTEPAGYLVKPFDEKNILAALEIALYNFAQRYIERKEGLKINHINTQIPTPLSEREFDVLNCIYEGKTNQQITDSLFISINTVKTHINNIYLKLDVSSRSQAITKIRNWVG